MPAAPTVHPDADTLTAFGLGRLPPDRRADVEAHVAFCEDCCRALEKIGPDSMMGLARAAMATPGPTADTSLDIPGPLVNHPRYKVLSRLGAGGMGVVYKAEHRMMGRTVALKVLNRMMTSSPGAAERFRREVRLASRLSHPNIVTAFDADEAGPLHFLVMEHIDGVSLDRWVMKKGPLPVGMACQFAREAALGLQHAYEKGMVHRDIKPHNLMVTRAGRIKVLDFGLARITDADDTSRTAAGVTAPEVVVGTPDFLAPEQARNSASVDHRADIYSLGCTLFYLLTARTPFAGATSIEKLMAHVQDDAPPVSRYRADLPPGLVSVVGRMMAKRPADRYQTPADVAAALAPFARTVAPPSKVSTPAAPPPPDHVTAEVVALTPPAAVVPADTVPTSPVSTPPAPMATKPTAIRATAVDTDIDAEPLRDEEESRPRRKRKKKAAAGVSPQAVLIGLAVAVVSVPLLVWAAFKLGSSQRSVAPATQPAPAAADAGKKTEPAAFASAPGASKNSPPTDASPFPPPPPGPGGVPPREVLAGRKVVLVVPPLSVGPDYDAIRREFEQSGLVVKVASDKRSPAARIGSGGDKVDVDYKLADLEGCDYDAVVFVGGAVRVFEPTGSAAAEVKRVVDCAKAKRRTIGGYSGGAKVLMELGYVDPRPGGDRPPGPPGPFGRGPRPGGPGPGGLGPGPGGVVLDPPFVAAGPGSDPVEFAHAVLRELGRPDR